MKDEILDIFDLSIEELDDILLTLNEKKFRSKQIYDWLHSHPITTYDDMHNIPKRVREFLNKEYPLQALTVKIIKESNDGTKKFLFECTDNNLVESVLIANDDKRLTACLSTQVGCPMQCAFCATGKQGFIRNLTAQEICFQVSHLIKHSQNRIDNIVIMGQGEPFLNYCNVIKAIKRLNHNEAFKIAARKITVSTCGIIDGIQKFSLEPEQFGLAVSLHSADQATRNVLMPKTKNIPLELLSEALVKYQQISKRRITFEYLLLEGINDDNDQCEKLIEFCKPLLCHVNLLKYNSIKGCEYKTSPSSKFKQFENNLINSGIACSVRKSKGEDIQGACGQLANSI